MDVVTLGMDPKGYDRVIFTATKPAVVAQRLLNSLVQRWGTFIIETDIDGNQTTTSSSAVSETSFLELQKAHHSVFTCSKSEQMQRHFQRHSYELMKDGEGAISYHFRQREKILFKLDKLVEVEQGVGELVSVEPYTAWFCADTILELTAVTPADPDSDPFSGWAMTILLKACKE
jgi:hypothetical protein